MLDSDMVELIRSVQRSVEEVRNELKEGLKTKLDATQTLGDSAPLETQVKAQKSVL